MAIPEFVTKQLFEKALQTYFKNNNVCIFEYHSEWAVPPGDNFTSDLLRCGITYALEENSEVKTMSVLVKLSPETRDAIINAISEMKLFAKEIQMYTKILPEMHKILGNSLRLSPQCIYADVHPIPLLIIEDLIPLRYKMLDRRAGLDLEHCLLVMKKIAQLHSASLVIHSRDSTAFDNYNESMFSGHPFVVNWIHVAIDCIAKACSERLGMQKYIPKLQKLKGNFFEKLEAAMKPRQEGLTVLNHGDSWTNNFMFLYDANGKLSDLKLIDFQLGVYSGPGADLQYFWSTTPNMSVRLEHFDTVLSYYHNELVSTLIKLDYPTERLPLKEDIYKDFRLKSFFGFAAGVTTLPLIKSDSRKDACLEELLKPLDQYEGSFREHVYTNANSWKNFEYLIPFLDELGVFD